VTLAVLTVQKEVAERLLAPPGCKDYGSLTLAVRQRVEVSRVRDIPAEAFRPPPRVDSTVVRLVPRARPLVEAEAPALMKGLIRLAFQQRRKMLRSALQAGPWEKAQLASAARDAGVALTARAEELALEDYGRLADALWRTDHRFADAMEHGR
jgi:16S rRNA (adenine1518-N6/adenine1519-N6)-dimethyltransferase